MRVFTSHHTNILLGDLSPQNTNPPCVPWMEELLRQSAEHLKESIVFWAFITLNVKAKDAAAVRSEMIPTAVTMYNIRWSLRKFS